MRNLIWLALLLAVFWIINSGHFDPLLLSFGVLSVGLVILVNRLMTQADADNHPTVILSPQLPGYMAWLLKEIVKSNLEVIRCIWQSTPEIEPTVIRIKASQQTDLFRVLYANSITMTPGTVTLEVDGDEFTVHALTRGSREGLESGDMDRRVRSLES